MFINRGSLLRKIQLGLINAVEGDDKGGGGSGEKWSDKLPEDARAWEEVTKAETEADFYKYVGDMRSHLGASIRIPGEDAGKEDWAAFNEKVMAKVPTLMQKPDLENKEALDQLYGSLGRPEKADGYEVPTIEGMDSSAAEGFKAVAHAAGLNNNQYTGIVKAITQANTDANEAAVAANTEAHKELAKKWGAEYDRRKSLAYTIAKLTDAPKDLQEMFKDGRANPESYEWMYNMALKFKGEGKNLLEDANLEKVGMTPDEASLQIAEIRGNKQHPYWDKTNPGHKAAMAKMAELYEYKAGKK